jgi:hypothetical protein
VILKKPEEFKIACLTDLRSLWPAGHNPFYAGFGNRDSDVVAYTEAGVPSSRILVINPQGEIRLGGQIFCWASYPKLIELCHHMFPFLISDDDDVEEGFSSFNFWRTPAPSLPPDGLDEPKLPPLPTERYSPHGPPPLPSSASAPAASIENLLVDAPPPLHGGARLTRVSSMPNVDDVD